jgi:hypothetical protein
MVLIFLFFFFYFQPNDSRHQTKDVYKENNKKHHSNSTKDKSKELNSSLDNNSISDTTFQCSASSVESLPSASGSSE